MCGGDIGVRQQPSGMGHVLADSPRDPQNPGGPPDLGVATNQNTLNVYQNILIKKYIQPHLVQED